MSGKQTWVSSTVAIATPARKGMRILTKGTRFISSLTDSSTEEFVTDSSDKLMKKPQVESQGVLIL